MLNLLMYEVLDLFSRFINNDKRFINVKIITKLIYNEIKKSSNLCHYHTNV